MAKDFRPGMGTPRTRNTTSTTTPENMPRVTKSRSRTMPTVDQIRARAYEIYRMRNGGPGDASADWKRAEQELIAELNR